MKPVTVPTTDVNSETARLVTWYASDGAEVRRGETIALIETSKAALDLEAGEQGVLLHLTPQGSDFPIARPVAIVFESLADLEQERARRAVAAADTLPPPSSTRATRKALELAEQHGIDLSALGGTRLITVKDVEKLLAQQITPGVVTAAEPLPVAPGVERIVLIGGGKGATQILKILRCEGGQHRAVTGILDDTPSKQGTFVEGVPILGPTSRLEELAQSAVIDSVVVAISTSVAARTRFREACAAAGVPLADNIIDASAVIAPDVQIGRGNVICALCHIGNSSVVGDNNFLSAFNSFDHHNVIGSDCSTGPGCKASGSVQLGDRVRLGTGIFIEPMVALGTDVQVASGAIIVTSVAPRHVVKTKVVTTIVVPLDSR